MSGTRAPVGESNLPTSRQLRAADVRTEGVMISFGLFEIVGPATLRQVVAYVPAD